MTLEELLKRTCNKKTGFTLAEVLISITVVGIVAALVIPAMIAKKDRREWLSGLNKAFTILSNGFKNDEANNGKVATWGEEQFLKYFMSSFNVAETCENNDCVPDEHYLNFEEGELPDNAKSYVLTDGQIMTVNVMDANCTLSVGALKGICGTIYVDINGENKPNTWSKDYFGFYITTSGIYPFGTPKTDVVIEGYEWTSQGCNNGEVTCAEGKTFSCASANTNETTCNTCGGNWTVYNKEAYSTPVYAHQNETYQVVGYVPNSYAASGYTPSGYTASGYTPSGYKANGYTPSGYTPSGYKASGYTPSGYTPSSYKASGYTPSGYMPSGYKANGYTPSAYTPSGYTPSGYTPSGYKGNGYTITSYALVNTGRWTQPASYGSHPECKSYKLNCSGGGGWSSYCGGYMCSTYVMAYHLNPAISGYTQGYKINAYSCTAYTPSGYTPNAWTPNRYTPSGYTANRYTVSSYIPNAYTPNRYTPSSYTPNAYTPNRYTVSSYTPNAWTPNSYTPSSYIANRWTPTGYTCNAYTVSGYKSVSGIEKYSHDYISTYSFTPAVHQTSCPNSQPNSVCLGYKYVQQWDCWYSPDGTPFDNDCNANGKAGEKSCNLEFKEYNALHDCNLDDRGTTCGAWAIINGNMIYLDDKQVYW